MTRASSGGGIQSRQVSTKREATRERPQVRAASPGAVSQLGSHMTKMTSSEPLYQGKSFQQSKFGNELATNVGTGGPGKGRTVMRSGLQGTHD
jgi:hypothetical protein